MKGSDFRNFHDPDRLEKRWCPECHLEVDLQAIWIRLSELYGDTPPIPSCPHCGEPIYRSWHAWEARWEALGHIPL